MSRKTADAASPRGKGWQETHDEVALLRFDNEGGATAQRPVQPRDRLVVTYDGVQPSPRFRQEVAEHLARLSGVELCRITLSRRDRHTLASRLQLTIALELANDRIQLTHQIEGRVATDALARTACALIDSAIRLSS